MLQEKTNNSQPNTANEFKYYLLYSSNNPKAPEIVVDDEIGASDDILLETPITNFDVIKFRFATSIKKPAMEDFLDNGVIGVISEKIYNILKPLNIKEFQLLPAIIHNRKYNIIYDKYYYLNMYNRIKCLDLENSKYSIDPWGDPFSITKIVLDKAVLAKIPLEDRLIFRMKEYTAYQLFHESIVKKIQESNPTGIRFINVKDWGVGSSFD